MIPKKKIQDGDVAVLKKAIRQLKEQKEKMDSLLEEMRGIPMNVNKTGEVLYSMRAISGDIEFCASNLSDILEKNEAR